MLGLIILNSLFIFGLKFVTLPNELLGKLSQWSNHLPDIIQKPLIGCLMCMSSIWGVFFFVSTKGWLHNYNYHLIVVHVVCLCGLNWIVSTIFNVLQDFGQKLIDESNSTYTGK